jgi:hypothetical protein
MSKVKFVGKVEIVGEMDEVVAAVETLGLNGDLFESVPSLYSDYDDYNYSEYFTFTSVVVKGNVFPVCPVDETPASWDIGARLRLGAAAKTAIQCVGDGRVCRPFSKRLRRKAQRTVSKAILRYEAEAA